MEGAIDRKKSFIITNQSAQKSVIMSLFKVYFQ